MGVLFFLSVLGYTAGFKRIFPRMKPGAAVLTSVCSMVFLAYLTVILFGLYPVGAYFVILLGFLALAAVIGLDIYENRCSRQDLKTLLLQWKERFFTPSMCVFLLLVFGSAFLLREMKAFSSHDNYSFWGRAVRELWIYDASYFNPLSSIVHTDYCAAVPALQYSIVRVFGWKNEYLCYVPVSLIAASLASIFDRFGWKNKWCAVFGTVCSLVLYPIAANTFDFDELLMDGPLAMLFAAGLILWVEREDDSFASILPVIAASFVLVTTKPYTGLMLAAVLLAAVFIHWLRNRKTMHYAPVLTLALVIMFAQFSWSAYYNYSTAIKDYEFAALQCEYLDIEQDIGERPEFSISYFFKGNPRNSTLTDGFSKESIRRNLENAKPHLEKLYAEKLYGASVPNVTALTYSLLIVIAMFVAAHHASAALRKSMMYSYLLTGISAALYLAGMLVTFLIVQPAAVSSTIRYAGIVLIILNNVLFYYLACLIAEGKKETKGFIAAAAAVMVLLVSPEAVYDTYFVETPFYSEEHAQTAMDSVAGMIGSEDRTLYIDNRNPNGQYVSDSGVVYCYRYCALPDYADAICNKYGAPYADDTAIREKLLELLGLHRANKIVLMADDAVYVEKYAEIFGVDPSVSQPWVLSVEFVKGEPIYTLLEPSE